MESGGSRRQNVGLTKETAYEAARLDEKVNLFKVRYLHGKSWRICGGHKREDASKPDGQPRRCLDTSRAEREFGFRARISFEEGLRQMIDWYRAQAAR